MKNFIGIIIQSSAIIRYLAKFATELLNLAYNSFIGRGHLLEEYERKILDLEKNCQDLSIQLVNTKSQIREQTMQYNKAKQATIEELFKYSFVINLQNKNDELTQENTDLKQEINQLLSDNNGIRKILSDSNRRIRELENNLQGTIFEYRRAMDTMAMTQKSRPTNHFHGNYTPSNNHLFYHQSGEDGSVNRSHSFYSNTR